MLFAGHETTATASSWAINHLARNLEVQEKVRAEVLDRMAGRDELSYEDLNDMPWLEGTWREALRLCPPVSNTTRVTAHDTVIPFSRPFKMRDGTSADRVVARKGTVMNIPILLLNTNEELWGPTARDFDPTRWFEVPEDVKKWDLPQHLMTFIAGPRRYVAAYEHLRMRMISSLGSHRFSQLRRAEIRDGRGQGAARLPARQVQVRGRAWLGGGDDRGESVGPEVYTKGRQLLTRHRQSRARFFAAPRHVGSRRRSRAIRCPAAGRYQPRVAYL